MYTAFTYPILDCSGLGWLDIVLADTVHITPCPAGHLAYLSVSEGAKWFRYAKVRCRIIIYTYQGLTERFDWCIRLET